MLTLPQGNIFIDDFGEGPVLDDKTMLLFEFDLMQQFQAKFLGLLRFGSLQPPPQILA
jgi:hypothetical protein